MEDSLSIARTGFTAALVSVIQVCIIRQQKALLKVNMTTVRIKVIFHRLPN